MEIWKDIKQYPGYQASNLGNIRKFKSNSFKLLKASLNKTGYYRLYLTVDSNSFTQKVHVLVAMAFHDFVPDNGIHNVDHINSNKTDNRSSNLRVVTKRENISKEREIKKGLPAGVDLVDGKFRSRITVNGKLLYLGRFNSVLQAHNAYQNKLKNI